MKHFFWKRIWVRMNAFLVFVQTLMRRHFGANGDLKVLSLLISTAIFFFVQANINYSGVFTAPLQISVRANDIAVLAQSDEEVKVTLKGSEDDIRSLDETHLAVRVQIRNVSQDTERQQIQLVPGDVRGAGKLRVVRVEPDWVTVEFDHEVERRLALALPTLLGEPLQGEASVELKRTFVTVRGPRSKLDKLIRDRILIPTESVDVTRKTQGFAKMVRVQPPLDSGISSVRPEEVEVKVMIENIPGPESSVVGGFEAEGESATTEEPSQETDESTQTETQAASEPVKSEKGTVKAGTESVKAEAVSGKVETERVNAMVAPTPASVTTNDVQVKE